MFNTVLTKKNTVLAKFNTVLAKFNTVLTKKNTAEFSVIFSYSVDSSLGRVPAWQSAHCEFHLCKQTVISQALGPLAACGFDH